MHHCPDNADTPGFRCQRADPIRPLPHVAEEALHGVGDLTMPPHPRWKRRKRQQMFLILRETLDRFRRAPRTWCFEQREARQSLLTGLLFPDAYSFDVHVFSFSSWDGMEDVARCVNR